MSMTPQPGTIAHRAHKYMLTLPPAHCLSSFDLCEVLDVENSALKQSLEHAEQEFGCFHSYTIDKIQYWSISRKQAQPKYRAPGSSVFDYPIQRSITATEKRRGALEVIRKGKSGQNIFDGSEP